MSQRFVVEHTKKIISAFLYPSEVIGSHRNAN
jgi:hypothetical protein